MNILDSYNQSPEGVRVLLENRNVKIQMKWNTRTINIEGFDYGDVDALAQRIISKKDKSPEDIKIAEKLAELYDGIDIRVWTPLRSMMKKQGAMNLSAQLRDVLLEAGSQEKPRSGTPDTAEISDDEYSDDEYVEASSVNKLDKSAVKSNFPRQDISEAWIPMEDLSYKRRLKQEKDEKIQKQQIQADFLDSLKQAEVDLVRIVGAEAMDKCAKITEVASQASKTPMTLPDGTTIDIRAESLDSIERGALFQISGLAIQYNSLAPKVKEHVSLETIQESVEKVLRLKSQESLSPIEEEELHQACVFLSQVFILDLREKLGEARAPLLDEVLQFMEQSYSNHLHAVITTKLGGLAKLLVLNPEKTINISSQANGKVVLSLVLKSSKEYKPVGELSDEIREFPHGIKATLRVELGLDPEDRSFSIKAEKLDDPPVNGASSGLYPIVMEE